MPQLDILASSISEVTSAPCSAAAPCYKIVMRLNNLSLAPTLGEDSNPDLVWLTQWFVPSSTDGNGGKNFIAYAESLNGGALQCFTGENAVQLIGGGGTLTYPGSATLPAGNCQSTLGPNGNITIYVPLSSVTEPGAIDSRLHEVTASTMTLLQPANSNPSIGGIGGLVFNLIDVAQSYLFDPSELKIVSIGRSSDGHVHLDCLGAPNALNTVQFSPDLLTPFQPLKTIKADAQGSFQFEDVDAGPLTERFYRLSLP
jgi:hypothetical protein